MSKEFTSLEDMLDRFKTYKKKELEYMLAGAIHKLEIARRVFNIIEQYEFSKEDEPFIRAGIREVKNYG